MFGIEILDVAIGLVFVYLMLSLVVTAANEACAAWFKSRARILRRGIGTLLENDQLAGDFFAHPLVRGLQQGGVGPSYIPSRTFALALLDLVAPSRDGKRELPPKASARGSVDHVLRLLWEESGGDVEKFKEQIEVWFSNSMERVSGLYKRWTQLFLLVWALVVTIGTNADTLLIAKALWRDPTLRQSLVTRAEQYVAEQPRPEQTPADQAPGPPPEPPDQQTDAELQNASLQLKATLADLNELDLPLGWQEAKSPVPIDTQLASLRLVTDDARDDWPGAIWPFDGNDEWGRWFHAFRQHGMGWLLTIFAVSLGAPFWFDTLNKIVSVRSVGKAPEEAQKAPKTVPKPREPGDNG